MIAQRKHGGFGEVRFRSMRLRPETARRKRTVPRRLSIYAHFNPGTRRLLVNSVITMIFNDGPDEWMGDAGLRKLCLNRPPEPRPPLNSSPEAVKDSTA